MKYIDNEGDFPIVELTRRNLVSLLMKLNDPLSACSLMDGERRILVHAVEDDEHYADRNPGPIWMPSADEYH